MIMKYFEMRRKLNGSQRRKERNGYNQVQKNIREKLKSVMNLHSQKSGGGGRREHWLAYTLWGKKHQGNIKGFLSFEAVS